MFGQAVFVGCCYEAAALATGRTPTITNIVHRHRDTNAVVLLGTCFLLGKLIHHLLLEEMK